MSEFETKWFTEYKKVVNPLIDKRGWNWPYNGGDWPSETDWYWVITGPTPDRSTYPIEKYWDNALAEFHGANDDVYAWKKMTPV